MDRLAGPAQQFAEGGVAGGGGAEDNRVDEEAGKVLQLKLGPAGHAGADHDNLPAQHPDDEGATTTTSSASDQTNPTAAGGGDVAVCGGHVDHLTEE